MARRSKRMHAVFPRDAIDRAVFIATFFIGVIGGIFLKVMETHSLYAALFSAGLLFIYAFLAWAGGRTKIEPETIGDNCYYLGFLFTLASLSFTLYQLADTTNTSTQIPAVISGFGVALSSTIVGVFLRVLLMQLRVDFVSKEREIRADINQSYADLRKQMAVSMQQMKSFSTESVQHASEREKRLREGTENLLEDQIIATKNASEQIAKSIDENLREVLTLALKDISETLQATSKTSQTALDQFVKDIETMRQQVIDLHTFTLKDRAQSSSDFIEETKTVKTQLSRSSAALSKVSDSLEATTSTINEGTAAHLKTIETQLAEQSESLLKIVKEHQETMKKFSLSTNKTAAQLDEKINPALSVLNEKLIEISETAHKNSGPATRFLRWVIPK